MQALRKQVAALTAQLKKKRSQGSETLAERLRDGLKERDARQEVGISIIEEMKADLTKQMTEDSQIGEILDGLPDIKFEDND